MRPNTARACTGWVLISPHCAAVRNHSSFRFPCLSACLSVYPSVCLRTSSCTMFSWFRQMVLPSYETCMYTHIHSRTHTHTYTHTHTPTHTFIQLVGAASGAHSKRTTSPTCRCWTARGCAQAPTTRRRLRSSLHRACCPSVRLRRCLRAICAVQRWTRISLLRESLCRRCSCLSRRTRSVFAYVCVYIFICIRVWVCIFVSMYMCGCGCVYSYVRTYVYIYIYIYIYIYMNTSLTHLTHACSCGHQYMGRNNLKQTRQSQ